MFASIKKIQPGHRYILGIDLGIASPCGLAVAEESAGQVIQAYEVKQKLAKGDTDDKIILMARNVIVNINDIQEQEGVVVVAGLEYAPFMQNKKTYGDMSRLAGVLIGMLYSRGIPCMRVTVGEGKSMLNLPTRGTNKGDVVRMVNMICGLSLPEPMEHAADACAIAMATCGKFAAELAAVQSRVNSPVPRI